MQFLVYIVILAVSLSTVLLELHWLTSPSSQPKSAIHGAVAPSPKPEGPNAELTPVYPKPETPRSVGSVTGAPDAAIEASAQAGPVASAKSETAKTELAKTELAKTEPAKMEPLAPAPVAPAAPVDAAAKVEPNVEPKFDPLQTTQNTKVELSGAATPADAAQPAISSATFTRTTQSLPAPAAHAATKNQCDVQGCAAVYASFRPSDCTYQPFEGQRQVCVKPAAAGQKATVLAPRAPMPDAARNPSENAELRDVEREVRRIAPPLADGDEDRVDAPSRVIVIRRSR